MQYMVQFKDEMRKIQEREAAQRDRLAVEIAERNVQFQAMMKKMEDQMGSDRKAYEHQLTRLKVHTDITATKVNNIQALNRPIKIGRWQLTRRHGQEKQNIT